jgi:hypothetical protein
MGSLTISYASCSGETRPSPEISSNHPWCSGVDPSFFLNYLHNNPHLINIHVHDDFDAYALQGLR